MNSSTERILEAAAEFLWSDELQQSLDSFSKNHAPMCAPAALCRSPTHFLIQPAEKSSCGPGRFEDAPPDATTGGEQRLEWTQAHIDFKQLFEFQLEQFVASQPFSQEEFLGACQDALDHGTWANCKGLVEVVLSMGTYECLPHPTSLCLPPPILQSLCTRTFLTAQVLREDDGRGGRAEPIRERGGQCCASRRRAARRRRQVRCLPAAAAREREGGRERARESERPGEWLHRRLHHSLRTFSCVSSNATALTRRRCCRFSTFM